jgi:hypothetical protein
MFNADEGGLCSNLLPDKISGFWKMKAILEAGGVKILLLCLLVNANMDGYEKMSFLVTGKSEKPGYSQEYEVLAVHAVPDLSEKGEWRQKTRKYCF